MRKDNALLISENGDNITPLKVITGGKDDDTNWLSKLKIETVFLTRFKARTMNVDRTFLAEYRIVNKSDKGILLEAFRNRQEFAWVDPQQFSDKMELFEILFETQEEENG